MPRGVRHTADIHRVAVVAASRWPYRGPPRSGGSGVAQL